ncbi:MAG: hypothetical protein ACXAEU_10470 [Candidatus Hodarchaeales archaeon]|jgi:chromosome segregation ATPase
MSFTQVTDLKQRIVQLKEYFDKTILIFESRIDEMEKSSINIDELNKKLDGQSSENSRSISDLTINLRESQEKKSALESKKKELLDEKELFEEASRKNAEEIESLQQKVSELSSNEKNLKERIETLKQEKEKLTGELSRVKPDFDKRQNELVQQKKERELERGKIDASFQAIRLLVQKDYLSTPETKIIEMIATQKGSLTVDILTVSTGLQKSIIENITGSLAKRGILEITDSGGITILKPMTLFTEKEV